MTATGTERESLGRLPGLRRPKYRHKAIWQRQRSARRGGLRIILDRTATRGDSVVHNRQRLTFEVDICPSQASYLSTPETAQRKFPGVPKSINSTRSKECLDPYSL
jgi:hypothetical protein